ncbi:3-dehydroquinate synthase [Rhodopirellula sp. MGV]|uniref:3-dehydroquinate synthase n=1 Tax=Rhodopirellula sp. MGV TaxID=2023130 RepID=UPI000B977B1A|nr:3-dehydroquinate synthase [Rhodopirellula sp. MGV]OYP37501.1 3-dehydroquinate synthase [Rhodopirellula sp. MGV]PNY37903.1 3-dehydroquinate synthase [Rhodopirellula baltica]
MESNLAAQAGETTVLVDLEDRSYPIHIASSATGRFAAMVKNAVGDLTHAVVIYDEAVTSLADALCEPLQSVSQRIDRFAVPSGETSKSVKQYETLLEQMLQCGSDRKSVVFAVGGGVIGDLAGFVAASFARGVRFVQVPTTLLAMVDSSVGGKTGINLSGAKNMVGAFWQPELVWIDTEVMRTLPDRSYLSGLAEVVKYGLIDDAEFFEYLESNAEALVKRQTKELQFSIARSCQSKANVVREDERETSGRRAILNYGHTFAHAIEATAGYGTLLHGEAVSIGMQMAASLAIDLGLCDASVLERQTELLKRCELPIRFPAADIDAMIPVMMRDKKVAHGKLRFILPRGIGKVDLVGDVDQSAVKAAIEAHR